MDESYNQDVTYDDFIQEDTVPDSNQEHSSGQHTVDLLNAAIPYLDVKSKNSLSFVVKASELMESLHSLGNHEDVSACGIDDFKLDFEGLLLSIRNVSYDAERSTIDLMLNFMRAKNFYQTYQTMSAFTEATNPADKTGDNSSSSSGNNAEMIELLKSMLPPEQQSSMDNISMIMNTMNAMNMMNGTT